MSYDAVARAARITAAAHTERTMDPAGQHNQAFSMLLKLFQIVRGRKCMPSKMAAVTSAQRLW